MKLTKKNILLLLVATIVALGGIGSLIFLNWKPAPQSDAAEKLVLTEPEAAVHHIVLTEKGFVPDKIVIRQDDTVVFSTELNAPFWPASNLHPSHLIYPEFDSKEKIDADKTWEFKFVKPGRFKYHDHLFANNIGLITVLTPEEVKAGASYTPTTDIHECSKFALQSEKQACWDDQLSVVLDADGIDAAFDYFLKLYKTDPEVPKECHGWGHTLGKAAYEIYKQNKELNLRPEASYCGYGYFHGFIGALIKDTGRVQDTKAFCEAVAKELDGKINGVLDNCIHGIGHGTTSMLLEEGNFNGDFMKVAAKGTEICEMIYTKKEDLENCYDGVFNELQLELFNNGYGMSYDNYIKLGDPFLYCKQQEEAHKKACYYELTGMFWRIFNHDVVAMTKYALANTEGLDVDGRGAKVLAKIAADQIQFDIVKPTHEKSLEACHLVPDYLYGACFDGILNGFIQHGEPDNLHDKAYAFCNEKGLSPEEHDSCYDKFTGMLKWTYSKEKMVGVCAEITKDRVVHNCDEFLPGYVPEQEQQSQSGANPVPVE